MWGRRVLDTERLIRAMPKVELHVHIEGTLEPEAAFGFAQRNGVTLPYASPDEMRSAYEFTDLQSFLDLYYAASSVLLTRRDFYDLTWMYLERAVAENVRHVEVFFDPQTHSLRGVAFSSVIRAISCALREARERHGITSRLIVCFLRDRSEAEAYTVLRQAEGYLHLIDGVGLDSSETGNPPEKFAGVFALARDKGLHAVAHAGEEGPAAYVRDSLDLLGAERIDHGDAALADPELVRRLVEDRVCLTVCPLSNVRLRVVDRIEDHPLKRMLDMGLAVTVNSDDPAYFGGYITENFIAVKRALGLSVEDLRRLSANAIQGSFLDAPAKAVLMAELDEFFARA
jgi:adenosine deaminase